MDAMSLSPTIPVLDSAPIGVGPISQLHPLIAVEGHAEPGIVVLGEFEPEGLDSLAVGCEYHKMTLLQIQAVY
jgi:hypothetical protein